MTARGGQLPSDAYNNTVPNDIDDKQVTADIAWDALEPLLDQLLDADPSQRGAILERVRTDNPALAARAENLLGLALDKQSLPASLDTAVPELFTALAEEDVRAHIGERLGPYRIVDIVRRGGMGIVFRGERADGAFEQVVAIKLIPASIAGETARALFERERQYLARLEHPNIARIIDAGVTERDTPYYIMEYIDGETIDVFLRDSGADRREILGHFLQLCDAVAYCHRSMIVHGDIKPGNVMVADDRVRLLDFGIGQMLEEVDHTEGRRPAHAFSPGFAAPEQERGEPATIQSDIFSLGALLRLLLANRNPSVDVAAIIDCCLSKDPADRYDSVAALRDDIRNHLNHYPVSVRAPTRRYRAGRFVRRNKLLVGATAAVFLALGAGLAAALWQFNIARAQAFRAEQVSSFLTSLFEQADPLVAGEREVTLREIVDDAAARLESELQDTPDVQAELTQLIGNAYYGLGDYDKALELHQRALSQWRSGKAGPSLEVVRALNAVASDYSKRGEYGKAEALARQAIDQLQALGLNESIDAATSWTQLGVALLQPSPTEGREAMLRAYEINLLVRPEDKRALARNLGNVAAGYRAEGDIEKSAYYHEQALATAEANNERIAPQILSIRCNLALDYGTLGRHEQALAAQKKCIEFTVERLGSDHPYNVPYLNNLGALDLRIGRLVDAEQTYLEALRIAEDKLPPMSLDRMASEINYAVVLWHSGRVTLAEERLRDLLPRMEQSLGAEHPASGRVRSILGRVLLERGDAERASRFISNSLQGLTPYWRSDALLWLAEANLATENLEAAADEARESLELRKSIPHFTDWQIAEAQFVLAVSTDDGAMREEATRIFEKDLPRQHFRRK